jgi:dimeric dUTPase (all-alpha-NTP-PPase superfamily)
MEEIFKRQRQLNVFTLKNIGVDFEETIRHPEGSLTWLENYRKALSAELAELVREVEEHGLGTQNGKVELVDMLHFLVSLSQIVGVEPQQIPSSTTLPKSDNFASWALHLFLALDDLQNSLKWKWWAKGGGFKPDRARTAVLALWDNFAGCCTLFDLDFPSLKKIYLAKNQVNFRRQNQRYNEDTKTEDDNQALEI